MSGVVTFAMSQAKRPRMIIAARNADDWIVIHLTGILGRDVYCIGFSRHMARPVTG